MAARLRDEPGLSECMQQLERIARYPPVAEVLARAQGRAGGASAEAVVTAVRSGRERS